MSGPIRGSIEHYFAGVGTTSGSAQTLFVNCYKFLNNNTGTLGIQRIAYNTGSQDAGMTQFRGMNFFDEPNPAGSNAFAVFRFASASNPWEMIIQWAGSNAFGTAPGSPGVVNSSGGNFSFGLMMAQATSGSVWAGTTLNNGNDRKATATWVSASNVAYYPRSNDHRRIGAFGTLKQNFMGIASLNAADYRAHFIADYDNFVFLFDQNFDNSYAIACMLKYTPLTDLTASLPYFSFFATLPTVASTQYGSVAGSSTDQGGISFPDLNTSGTCILSFEKFGTTFFQTNTAQPNKMFSTQRFDEYPFYVGANESPNQIGFCGHHYEFLREVYNIATHDTNLNGTRAVFGNTTLASLKVTVPWHSGTTPGTGINRAGTQFGL